MAIALQQVAELTPDPMVHRAYMRGEERLREEVARVKRIPYATAGGFMLRSVVTIATLAILLSAVGSASAQTKGECQTSRIFDEPVHTDSFPMTPVWGVGLDVIGSATDVQTPKVVRTVGRPEEAGNPSNFYIANDNTKRLHVWVCTRTNVGFSTEFDLLPGSFYETSLAAGLYAVTVSTARSTVGLTAGDGQSAIWFGVLVDCAPTCYTYTRHIGVGTFAYQEEVWAYKRFKFFIQGRDDRKYQPTAAISGPPTGALAPSDNTIQQEIGKIRNGRNAPMPPAQAAAANLGGQTGILLENGTTYTLTVFVSGPMSQRIQLAPGGSKTLTLSPGNYEVAASVSGPGVVPFYGKETLSANTQYTERFYIQGR
jgi:hypothetical protein